MLLLGFGLGSVAGLYVDQVYPDQVPLIGKPKAPKSLDRASLERALAIVHDDYYGGGNLNYTALSHGTVRGLVEGLNDRFSYYLDPDEYQRQLSSYSGRYTGIGIEVSFTSDYPVVSQVFPGSPAEAAGLQPGDAIVAVDGRPVTVRSDLPDLIGEKRAGQRVSLQVVRGHDRRTVEVTLGKRPLGRG